MKHDKTPLQLRSFATCNVNKLNYTQQPPRQAFNLLYVLMLYTATLWKIDIHWSRQSLAGSSLCCLARLSMSTLLLQELLARLERGLGHSGWVLVLSWMARGPILAQCHLALICGLNLSLD